MQVRCVCDLWCLLCDLCARGHYIPSRRKNAADPTSGKAGPGREVGNAVIGDVHAPPDPGGLGEARPARLAQRTVMHDSGILGFGE
jgi:hypothetical protein